MIRIICVLNINYDIIIYDMITYDLFKQSSLEKWPKLYCQQYHQNASMDCQNALRHEPMRENIVNLYGSFYFVGVPNTTPT